MKVLKFGGTSVGSAEAMRQVAQIVAEYHRQNQDFVLVSSAMKGVTNKLEELGQQAAAGQESYHQLLQEIEEHHLATVRDLFAVKEQGAIIAEVKKLTNELEDLLHGVFLLRELSARTMDLVYSFGERLAVLLLANYIDSQGIKAQPVDARQLIKTDEDYGRATVDFVTTNQNIFEYFKSAQGLQVVTGFIASTPQGVCTTLGRGGSDYTASIIGAALNVSEIEIWTDVDGVMTTDPRKVKNSFSLKELTYEEAMEMSHFGAKVIYPPSLQPAFNKNIPLCIKNTFNPSFAGTAVKATVAPSDYDIKGLSSITEISLLNVTGSGMVGVPGISSRLFGVLAKSKVNIILITQASSEHSICFATSPQDTYRAKLAIEEEFSSEIAAQRMNPVLVENGLSVVAIIGENMKARPNISGKLFGALGKNGINVSAIAQGSSELNLSVVVSNKDLSKALNILHEAFFLSDTKVVNIFLLGVGLIGSTLLEQIKAHKKGLAKDHKLSVRLVAAANSRKMLFDPEGLNLDTWKDRLEAEGEENNLDLFLDRIGGYNLPNSILVDCTSSNKVLPLYEKALSKAVSIVTPNKLANSGTYADYVKLKDAATKAGVKFFYETNVGAGLPVISTMADLKNSGDKIIKIEGVLSGTLSYIFNTFSPDMAFSEVVRQAKQLGYTEPDPRDDLNGMDVARKILILAREAGYPLEPSDVDIVPIIPTEALEAADVGAFFEALEAANAQFETQLSQATQAGQKLRVIASLEDGKATVKLQAVGADHPLYGLSGSDNMISFITERYTDRPLVIKGPGAGAEVTAAGVFAEIVTIGNYLS